MENEISIDEAIKKPENVFNALMYGSYAANRSYGMTHEQLLSIGIGNEEMKIKYETSKK